MQIRDVGQSAFINKANYVEFGVCQVMRKIINYLQNYVRT